MHFYQDTSLDPKDFAWKLNRKSYCSMDNKKEAFRILHMSLDTRNCQKKHVKVHLINLPVLNSKTS